MASAFSHPAVALGLFPWFRDSHLSKPTLVFGALLTVLPDADVLALRFGVPYGDTFGHRGFTHSLLFAGLISAVFAFSYPGMSGNRFLRFLYFFGCATSHGVLDAMTNGGLGVAFWSPFSPARVFFSWRPIEVSPIGVHRFFSVRGLTILKSELGWIWLPSILVGLVGIALRYRKARRSYNTSL